MSRKQLRINRYLRATLCTNWGFYVSFLIESQQSCEGGALACTSLTGPVGEGKQAVCAGQPLTTRLTLHPGGKKITSVLAVFSAL